MSFDERSWCYVVEWHLWRRPFQIVRHAPPRDKPWQSTPCGLVLDYAGRPKRNGSLVSMSSAIAELFTRPCRRCFPEPADG